MSNYNHCTFLGRLTHDPSHRTTPSGMPVVNGTIAVNKKKDGKDVPTFIRFKIFDKQADTMKKYCVKGQLILLEGELQQDKWEGRDGPRSEIVLLAHKFVFMPRTREAENESSN